MDPPGSDQRDAQPQASADALVERLALSYGPRLRFFAVRHLGDPAAAEEAGQEALRRVLEAVRAGKVAEPEALPSFAYQTVRHICLHHWRSAGREGRALERLHGLPRAGDPDPLAEVIGRERTGQIARALAALRRDDRELLRALYFEEEDPRTLAERLGITAGALRVRRHRALRRLAAELGDEKA